MSQEIQINNEQIIALLNTISNKAKAVTCYQFEQEYLSFTKNNFSEAYYSSIKLSFNHLLSFFPKEMDLYSISQREAERFVDQLKKRVPSGYRVYYRNLKAAFNKAIDWGYISANPFKKIRLPKVQENKPHFITEDELNKILKCLDEKALSEDCTIQKANSLNIISEIVITAFYTGMRLGELHNLRWENVSLDDKYIVVGDAKFTTKGRKQRIVPIENKLTTLFKEKSNRKKSNSDFVFAINGRKRLTKDYVSKTFKSICREIGLDENISFHKLRHSFASNLAQKGVSPFQLKELLGHSSVAVTEKYSHLNLDSLRSAISKFDETN